MTPVEEALTNLAAALAERDAERQDQLDRIEKALADITRTRDFYTVSEVARILRKRPAEVTKMIDEGRLWIVEGLDSSHRMIPQAALDSLQQRPGHLKAVAS